MVKDVTIEGVNSGVMKKIDDSKCLNNETISLVSSL
jgi:hypothetical protein